MRTRSFLPVGLAALVLTALVFGGCASKGNTSGTTTSTSTSTPPTISTSAPAGAVTINLTAQNIAFDTKQIAVRAGAAVTINFTNKDSGVPHNFSVYQNLSTGQTKAIFVGQTITGPDAITYNFTAPPAGNSYFFECDVHPTIMNGTFSVTP